MKRHYKRLGALVFIIAIALSGSSSAASVTPIFSNLPGTEQVINLSDGETITVTPFTIMVRPTSDIGINRVEFDIHNVGVSQHFVSSTPDGNGIYSFVWDTSQNKSLPPIPSGYGGIPERDPEVRVVAYDTSGESVEISRTVSVVFAMPYTGK